MILLNTVKPYSEEARALKESLETKYQVQCMALNCDQLRKQDVDTMMHSLLYEFPVTDMEFYLPRWLDVLPKTHELKSQMIDMLKELIGKPGR